ncbi:TIGR03986 family CRISPR-associated RAMP protein [Azospirillum sp. RWY-5-1]|uniref:TIGR03986 family CRISPR-associated RAMP protein n=1 Tax=Azospirillum oleiclasticum TaxID=2735135 RepID=A0ABX2T8W0_9PROT|nr:TIGR03986 family CRISPR-associated RAMP protein [Azospirillum oleiclasticum]NYZ13553.1 TIGR03986 family CRISPR-associated RAMP protein [Azospirillum oleiclasticum]NYZ20713.1 TIGR03986 family CRISPR-associated RAMP protein [Azospirillum oleiclasticum]
MPAPYRGPSRAPQPPRRGGPPAPASSRPAEDLRLTAPYAFVPINERVYLPDWHDRVSHEIPFEDGFCGRFWIEVTARTPLFIGGGDPEETRAVRRDRKSNERAPDRRRFEIDGEPAIPGSSLRGLIASVVEIASFGKMGPRIDPLRFSFRDLQNPKDYVSHFTAIDHGLHAKSKAGWLSVDPKDGTWRLTPCDWSVVLQEELEALHRRRGAGGINLGDRQGAVEKYKAWRLPRELRFRPGPWTAEGAYAKGRHLSRAAELGSPDGVTGTLVFTGQPARRGDKGTKTKEFLFHSPAPEPLPVPDAVREDFEWAHRDPVTGAPNKEWAHWRKELFTAGGRVPVFWLEAETADEQKAADSPFKAMGLAMMFRLAGTGTSLDAAWNASPRHRDERPDLAECVFGFAADRAGKDQRPAGLKGRVRIGHGRRVTPGDPQEERPVELVLIGPKPAFYPAYLAQPERDPAPGPARVRLALYDDGQKDRPYGAYHTWTNPEAKLRGWKRYPVTSRTRVPPPDPDARKVGSREDPNRKIATGFTPAGSGSVFHAPVDVHNLRRVELGAIVWALTFGGRAGLCHALGMARPFGFGAVEIRLLPQGADPEYGASLLEDNATGTAHDGDAALRLLEACRDEFAAHMDGWLRKEGVNARWQDSDQIRSLLATADPAKGDAVAAKGGLAQMADPKTFQKVKNTNHRLILPAYPPGEAAEPRGGVVAAVRPAPGKPGAGPAKAGRRTGVYFRETVIVLEERGDTLVIRYEDDDERLEVPRADVKLL